MIRGRDKSRRQRRLEDKGGFGSFVCVVAEGVTIFGNQACRFLAIDTNCRVCTELKTFIAIHQGFNEISESKEKGDLRRPVKGVEQFMVSSGSERERAGREKSRNRARRR